MSGQIRSAALRVESFLDERRRGLTWGPRDRLLTAGAHNTPLNESDLRALIAAVLAMPEEAAPFTWYVKYDRKWHTGCDGEVVEVRGYGLACMRCGAMSR